MHEAQAIICVQVLDDAQKDLQNTSISVSKREELERSVHYYESYIQTFQQDVERTDADLVVERSALQGESYPKGNRFKILRSFPPTANGTHSV